MFSFSPSFIDSLLQKNSATFDSFYVQTVDVFYRYIKSHFSLSDGEVHDLISDVYVKIWWSLDNFDRKYNFESYVRTILKNTVKDYFKKSKSITFSSYTENREITIDDFLMSDEDIAEEFEKNYLFNDIDREIKKMDQLSQDLLHFRFVEQRSYDDISLITGIASQNLRKKISRIVSNLRNRLKKAQKS